MSRAWLGVDPGWNKGALAVIGEDGGLIDVCRLSQLTPSELSDWVCAWAGGRELVAAVEKVGTMPGQGVSSSFKFGRGLGRIEGLLVALGVPYEEVPPRAWQTGLVPAGLDKQDRKRALKAATQQRWPERRWTLEDADAPLIALWARERGTWSRGEA